MPGIQYIHGHGYVYNTSRGPKHQWDFEVEGLEDFAVTQVAPLAYENYSYWMADDVPEGVLFTVAEHDGSRVGCENICRFSICEVVSAQTNLIKARYGNCMIDGNYRIVAHGNTPIRAHRLFEWWYRYRHGDDRTVDYAEHCATYMEKKWTKKKPPPMDEPIDILLKAIGQKQKVVRFVSLDSALSDRLNAVADSRQSSIDQIIEQALQSYFNQIDSSQPNLHDNH
jgi:hypothetical protein